MTMWAALRTDEMTVVIYKCADSVTSQKTCPKKEFTNTQWETTTQPPVVTARGKCGRLAAICLGLLSLLLITNILLYMYYNKVNDNLTEENIILQTRYDSLVKRIERRYFKDWKKNGSSFYFFSRGKETWEESRQNCSERGADLVIINNKEEQMFLIDQYNGSTFWIGLTDKEIENTWKWVDGQLLTEEFWRKGEPNNADKRENCAVFTVEPVESDQKTWNDFPCFKLQNWVCEFNLTNIRNV
ncbi:C-type lectin domain family 4 member E-like isoform X2 [Hoplias malabaricus]|uniref:C-type lectin domain family 4 member E-like isoform X2 n=1 Tax=Hoplias malabaricus TaxID=27720 RepID=UPI003462F612